MKRRLFFLMLALGLFATATPQNTAQAQSPVISRGGVQYDGYGRGYYGGYGHGHSHGGWQGTRVRTYSGYGYGPYGYGSDNAYQYPVNSGYGYGSGYSYGNGNYYNGYGNSGYYVQPYAPVYRPYGFGVYIQ